LWLYHGNCLELLDAIAAKYPADRFDAIFADPPYFLSNGGITCHAGRMVKVDNLQPSFVPATSICRCSVGPPA
jgi:site-specific DNA-methyltransferase (adenine-specific)